MKASSLQLPSQLTFILSIIAGVIVAFVASNIITLEPAWSQGIQIGLTILAAWGISPLTGTSFRAVLHLSNGLAVFIAGTLTALQIVFLQVNISAGLHGVIAGVLAFAGGLGFAPSIALATKAGRTRWL